MLYREIIAVCSGIHSKHINTLCGQKVEFVKAKPGGTKRIGPCRYPKTTATFAYSFNSLPTVHTDRSTECFSQYFCVFPFMSAVGHGKVIYMYYETTVRVTSCDVITSAEGIGKGLG